MQSNQMMEKPLPEGWLWVKLGDVCSEKIDSYDPTNDPDEFYYVDISSIDNIAKKIKEPKLICGKDAPSRARQLIFQEDVIVSITRPNLNAVAIVPKELDKQICSTGFCVLRAGSKIISDYLFHFVQSDFFVDNLSNLVKGALYPAVTNSQVRSQLIPLPPLPEQQRIAARLREQMQAVDEARQAVEAQLKAINQLPAALLRQAFSGAL